MSGVPTFEPAPLPVALALALGELPTGAWPAAEVEALAALHQRRVALQVVVADLESHAEQVLESAWATGVHDAWQAVESAVADAGKRQEQALAEVAACAVTWANQTTARLAYDTCAEAPEALAQRARVWLTRAVSDPAAALVRVAPMLAPALADALESTGARVVADARLQAGDLQIDHAEGRLDGRILTLLQGLEPLLAASLRSATAAGAQSVSLPRRVVRPGRRLGGAA